ncbi:hypothetical protein H0194_03430 [Corynebacterium incognita]|uniref:Uncharacterized protein n=1 Tax=Corynebacterium incognita TaxID=2754725 RepID=A0A7G7CR62_9CORY|nr:hypothetical protein [Corynebacterium incognita]QNE90078.1 hypothetical protein H0194_03430 [Corynebacterium incognita]
MQRKLTPEEEFLLMAICANADPVDGEWGPTDEHRMRWIDSIRTAHVTRECGCGSCPSFEIGHDTDPNAHLNPLKGPANTVLSAYDHGGYAEIFLHISDNTVWDLDIAPPGDGIAVPLPTTEMLSF